MMVITVTLNPSIDVSCHCAHVSPDRKLRCRDTRSDPGGGGIKVCRVIQELGSEAGAVWMKGGASGQILAELLEEAGVRAWPVDRTGAVRHCLYVREEQTNREFRFVLPGSPVSHDELDAVGRQIETLRDDADYLVFSGSLPPGAPPDCYIDLAEKAPSARVVVDVSGEALRRAARSGVFLLKPNVRELAELAGCDRFDSDAEIARAAREVVDAGGAQYVLVSLAAGGAQLVSAEVTLRLHAPTVKVDSTVGAGDSMVAGVVLGFAQGRSPEQAARLGVAAGTAAVKTPGTELCRSEDAWRLVEDVSVSIIEP